MPRKSMPQIKNEDQYEALRDKGYSKSTSAKIANSSKSASVKGGKHPAYEDWTKDKIYNRAKELDISGRASMNKSELIKAVRGSRYRGN